MNTEIFNSGDLFGKVEPALLEKWIDLPEVRSSNFANGRYGFRANESLFRFNRRFWEPQLPDQLLQATVDQVPILASLDSF